MCISAELTFLSLNAWHGERRAAVTADGEKGVPMKKTGVMKEPLVRVIEGGNHALKEEIHRQMYIKGVEEFLTSLTRDV